LISSFVNGRISLIFCEIKIPNVCCVCLVPLTLAGQLGILQHMSLGSSTNWQVDGKPWNSGHLENMVNLTVIIPIPQYGPGYSGYGKAQYQPVTGSYGQGPSGTGQGGSSFTGQNPGPTVGGTRSKLLCLHSTNIKKLSLKFIRIRDSLKGSHASTGDGWQSSQEKFENTKEVIRSHKWEKGPANVNGTKIIIPIPQYGPGYSGYGKAQYQPVTGS
jgi:hypothetical protein